MKFVFGYLRRCASMLMLCLVLMAGFSASMNILLTHDVIPDMETVDHQLDPMFHHDDHSRDFDLLNIEIADANVTSHKHIHNAADHSHDTAVTLQRKPINVFRKIARLTISIPSIPNTDMFYSLDRPPAVS